MVTDRSDWTSEDRIRLLEELKLAVSEGKNKLSFSEYRLFTACFDYERVHDEIPDGYLEFLIKLKNKIVS